MRPFLHLSPTVITDRPLLRLGQNVITDGTFNLLHLGLNQNIDIWPESLGVMSEFNISNAVGY